MFGIDHTEEEDIRNVLEFVRDGGVQQALTAVLTELSLRKPPNHRKETQTAVVWTCLPFIRSGQNHFARHSERGGENQTGRGRGGRQHQGMGRPGVRQLPKVDPRG